MATHELFACLSVKGAAETGGRIGHAELNFDGLECAFKHGP